MSVLSIFIYLIVVITKDKMITLAEFCELLVSKFPEAFKFHCIKRCQNSPTNIYHRCSLLKALSICCHCVYSTGHNAGLKRKYFSLISLLKSTKSPQSYVNLLNMLLPLFSILSSRWYRMKEIKARVLVKKRISLFPPTF